MKNLRMIITAKASAFFSINNQIFLSSVIKSKKIFFYYLFIAFFLVSSCKKEKYIIVSGRILNEQTKTPINGLSVCLSQTFGSNSFGSGGGWSIIETKTTDNSGVFSFYVKVTEDGEWKVDINATPYYNSKYSTNWFTVYPDTKYSKTIYIYRNTTLTVNSITNNQLGATDTFYMELPGIACKCDNLTTTRAKGNAYNIISWTVIRNNLTNHFKDSIYCPVDIPSSYTINY